MIKSLELAGGALLFFRSGYSLCSRRLFPFRCLGTPTEATWKGVSQLPDYKESFPMWKGSGLKKAVPYLDDNGIDLLAVRYEVFNLLYYKR